MVRSRRTITREFKTEVVRMVEEGERPVKEVVEQLEIHPQLLYRWRKVVIIEQKDAFPGQGNVSSSEEGLRRHRHINRRTR